MVLGILKGTDHRYNHYIASCIALNIQYVVIDITTSEWIENVMSNPCDGYLHIPPCDTQTKKCAHDEVIYFLETSLNKPVYPTFKETYIYENKRNMYYFLKTNHFPHVDTHVFTSKQHSKEFIENNQSWPLYFKTNIGSAGIGVKKIKNKRSALKISNKTFSNLTGLLKGYTRWYKTKFGISFPLLYDKQFDVVIFQKSIDVKWEWRIIKIGDSFFGHKKLPKENGFCSGSGMVGWDAPPLELLDIAKELCEKGGFNTMDIDIFESNDGKYYINELQAIFGSYDHSQMYIDGKPGRFKFVNSEWIFEEGYFNQNYSCDLRVKNLVEIIKLGNNHV